jgi:hypothetical protein
MQADLHRTVPLATQLLRASQPRVKAIEARRLVAKMLCYEPPALHGNGESSLVFIPHEIPKMTNKSSKMFSHLSGPPPHATAAVPTSDRFETASADRFPGSGAPGWTVVTCVGALRTDGGPLHNEGQL